METDRNIRNIGIVNLLAFLLVGGAVELVSRYANSAAGQVGAVFLGLGFLVGAVSYFQMRLEARERLEKLEFDELQKAPASAALFTQDTETFPAKRAREQFERFFIPAFSVLLVVLQGVGCVLLWSWLTVVNPPLVERTTIALALSALFALIFYLLGKYSAGIARLEGQRLLRPGASYLVLGAFICLLTTIAEAFAWFGFARVDVIVARVLCVILGLVAVEILINLVLEIYRPRLRGQVVRLLYESRLISLLGQPGGIITTAAQALDYQFGFKVSETWFYQFLEKALAWLILLQLAILFLSTTVVVIGPQEEGVLERFGHPVAGRTVLQPGFHLKWPWPIDKAYVYATRQIHTFYVGFVPDPTLEKERTIAWTRPHSKEEFNLLVASREQVPSGQTNAAGGGQAVPVNLLSVNIPVQYRITNVLDWAYHDSEPEETLTNLANREMVRYLINVDVEDVMGPGRLKAAEQLKERLQRRANSSVNNLGVEIVYVGLEGIHPPVKVAPAYEEVAGAMQEKQTNILDAEAFKAQRIPQASAQATNLVSQAHNQKVMRVATAAATACQFTNQLTAFHMAPQVYLERAYLEALVAGVTNARKYVLVTTNTQDVLWLNLEDKIRPDLENLALPAEKKGP